VRWSAATHAASKVAKLPATKNKQNNRKHDEPVESAQLIHGCQPNMRCGNRTELKKCGQIVRVLAKKSAHTTPHAMRHGLGFTMSAACMNPQTIAQALGHQSARMALQFYGSVTDEVADRARKQTFSKYSWL
jgi:integrase